MVSFGFVSFRFVSFRFVSIPGFITCRGLLLRQSHIINLEGSRDASKELTASMEGEWLCVIDTSSYIRSYLVDPR